MPNERKDSKTQRRVADAEVHRQKVPDSKKTGQTITIPIGSVGPTPVGKVGGTPAFKFDGVITNVPIGERPRRERPAPTNLVGNFEKDIAVALPDDRSFHDLLKYIRSANIQPATDSENFTILLTGEQRKSLAQAIPAFLERFNAAVSRGDFEVVSVPKLLRVPVQPNEDLSKTDLPKAKRADERWTKLKELIQQEEDPVNLSKAAGAIKVREDQLAAKGKAPVRGRVSYYQRKYKSGELIWYKQWRDEKGPRNKRVGPELPAGVEPATTTITYYQDPSAKDPE